MSEDQSTTRRRRPQTEAETEQLSSVAVEELHLVEDLFTGALQLLKVTPEAFAGAVAHSGWEMTHTVTINQARLAVAAFQSIRA